MAKFICTIFTLLIFLQSWTGNAQQVRATASIDSSNILIGDQVKLMLQISHPKNMKITFPVLADSILGKIEVLEKQKIDTTSEKEFQKLVQSILITSFDSGLYRIPNFWFKTELNGTIDSVPTNEVLLHVHSMKIDTSKGLTDIKMPYAAPLTLKEVTPYILGIILIGAVIFLLLYSIKRKKRNQPIFLKPQKPKEPAYIVALRELDRIKEEKLWQKEKTKQYYSELTETLRTYIEESYGIPAMEQTSVETLESFRIRKDLITEKNFVKLQEIFSISDLVKFAKYKPLPDEDNLALVNSYFFVNETKPEEPKKPESQEDKEINNETVTK